MPRQRPTAFVAQHLSQSWAATGGRVFFFFFLHGVNASCTDIGWLVRPPDRVWDSYRLVAPTH